MPIFIPQESAEVSLMCAWKRAFDLLCILLGFPLVLLPVALVALWIKAFSRGPVLFRQERIGKNKQRFVLYKFRTMVHGASQTCHERHVEHLIHTRKAWIKLDLSGDSRLIPGARFLRSSGLDELPQLLNVLRGEMSLIGPRPCLPGELRFFTPRHEARFSALPGLTGMWQAEDRSSSTFLKMNAMDAFYAQHASPLLDLVIMVKTPVALMRQISRELYSLRKPVGKIYRRALTLKI